MRQKPVFHKPEAKHACHPVLCWESQRQQTWKWRSVWVWEQGVCWTASVPEWPFIHTDYFYVNSWWNMSNHKTSLTSVVLNVSTSGAFTTITMLNIGHAKNTAVTSLGSSIRFDSAACSLNSERTGGRCVVSANRADINRRRKVWLLINWSDIL